LLEFQLWELLSKIGGRNRDSFENGKSQLSVLAAAEVAQLEEQVRQMELRWSHTEVARSEASTRGSSAIHDKSVTNFTDVAIIQNQSLTNFITGQGCQHSGSQYFIFLNSPETDQYILFTPSDNHKESDALSSRFDSIRDAVDFRHTDEARQNMFMFLGGTFGFEWHKGRGDEKYFRCCCRQCGRTTDRIYTDENRLNGVRVHEGGERLGSAENIFKAIFNVSPDSVGYP
jgi:hypothetical protein